MKKVSLILIIVMIMSLFVNVGISNAGSGPIVIPTEIDPNSVKPLISVKSGTEIPVFTAGNMETLTLPIKNDSNSQARNLTISLEVENKENFPFIIDKINLSKYVGTLDGHGSTNVSFDLEVDQYAVEGIYTVKLNYNYSNMFGFDYSSTEQIMIRVVNKSKAPKLIISQILSYPKDITPGKNATISLKVNNIGTLDAKDVKFTLIGLRGDGFSLNNSTDVKYITSIGGEQQVIIDYPVTTSKDIAGGNHPLEVKMEYKDAKNNTFTESSQIFISIVKEEESKTSADITIEKVESPSGTLSPDQEFTVSFNITNKGKGKANHLKAFISAEKEIYSKSVNTIIVDSLEAGESQKVSFSFASVPNTPTKNYPIALNVEYDEDKNSRGTITQYVGVYIEGEEESGSDTEHKSTPRIIVSNYTVDPSQVNAGDTFKLGLTFLNTNRLTSVRNIKVSIISDDGTFIPASSSSTFYIENISTQESVYNEILLSAKGDAAPKSYTLGINFEYEDSKGNAYNTREIVSIPVLQSPRLVTGEINFPPESFVGQPMPVYIDFYNMGKSTLYNLMVTAEGEFQVMGSGYYVGNFEPGRSDSFDNTIMLNSPGDTKGDIVFSFEDASGKQVEVRKEFSINGIEMNMHEGEGGKFPEDMPMPGQEDGKSIPKIWIIIGSITLLAILLIAVAIIRKKIKTRKELEFDEEF